MSACKLCLKEHLTRWYYEDGDIWVADDLDPKGYAKRILGVWDVHSWNIPLPILAKLLTKVMEVVNREYGVVDCEWDPSVSIDGHFHIQLNIKSLPEERATERGQPYRTCQLCSMPKFILRR